MSRLAPILALAVLALSFPGCEKARVGAPDELVVGLEGAPKSLDPRVAQDAYSERILPLIFESLVLVGKNSEPAPHLASKVDQPDELTYVFSLRQGHRFPDGTEITARDVVFTIKSLADPELKSPRKYVFDKIAEVHAEGDYTVVVKLKEVYAPFLHELTFGIVPAAEALDKKAFWKSPYGSGPYQVQSHASGERVTLVANPEYAGARPAIDRIVFRVLEDDVTRVLALEHGEVHLLQNSTPPDDVPLVSKNPRLRLKMQQGINYTYIGLNLDDPLLKDVRVRKAIAHAIDRETIARCLLNDTVSLASGLLSPSHWAYNGKVTVYDFDPGRARSLLDEAGFVDPDGDGPLPRFELLYKTSQKKERRWIVESIADQLGEVGIEVKIRVLEFGTFFDDVRAGRFQMYTLTWPGVTEPDVYHYIFHSKSTPPNGGNRNRFRNAELDRLTEQGRLTPDREQRRAAYVRVQEIVADELPYISLWYGQNTAAMDRRLQGFEFYPGGDYRSLAGARWD